MLQHPEKALLPKDESLIPQNTPYCYTITEVDGPRIKTTHCPYYDYDDKKPEQSCGYCHFIEKGDWMVDGTLLLWDGCKECGISRYEDVQE